MVADIAAEQAQSEVNALQQRAAAQAEVEKTAAETALSMAEAQHEADLQREEAIRMLEHSIDLQPHPEAHFNLAAAYLGAEDYRRAEEQIDAAILLRPSMSEAWKYKARLLAARNEQVPARDAFIRVLQLQPLDLKVYGELIDLLRALGEPEEAERYLELGMRMSRMLAEL